MWIPFTDSNLNETLSPEEMQNIKLIKIREEEISENVGCAICLLDYSVNEEVRELNCEGRHKFHELCLFYWLQSKRTCPMCRELLIYPADSSNHEDD